MKKTEAIQVLEQLDPTEKVRLMINTYGLFVDSTQTADYHIFWLKNKFASPWDENQQETDCVQLESKSFDFALAYNSVMNKVETLETVEYTKEQEYEMQDLQNQIEQTQYYN